MLPSKEHLLNPDAPSAIHQCLLPHLVLLCLVFFSSLFSPVREKTCSEGEKCMMEVFNDPIMVSRQEPIRMNHANSCDRIVYCQYC